MVIKEDSIIITDTIQTINLILRSHIRTIKDMVDRNIKFNKSQKVYWIDSMRDLKKDRVFLGMKWIKSMQASIIKDKKMIMINGD